MDRAPGCLEGVEQDRPARLPFALVGDLEVELLAVVARQERVADLAPRRAGDLLQLAESEEVLEAL